MYRMNEGGGVVVDLLLRMSGTETQSGLELSRGVAAGTLIKEREGCGHAERRHEHVLGGASCDAGEELRGEWDAQLSGPLGGGGIVSGGRGRLHVMVVVVVVVGS
jgi:hypothetical protein